MCGVGLRTGVTFDRPAALSSHGFYAGVLRWEEDTDHMREVPPSEYLLDTLMTMHKLLRLAFKDGECWMVEVLELERQSVAAQCAYALRDRSGTRPAG